MCIYLSGASYNLKKYLVQWLVVCVWVWWGACLNLAAGSMEFVLFYFLFLLYFVVGPMKYFISFLSPPFYRVTKFIWFQLSLLLLFHHIFLLLFFHHIFHVLAH